MLVPPLDLARRAADGRATRRASLHVEFRLPARRPNRQTNRCCRSVRPAVSPGERRGQLTRESELFVRCYVFVRRLTRPPNHLGMPLTPTPPSRNHFAPGETCVLLMGIYPAKLRPARPHSSRALQEIGRASCRERVESWGMAGG